MLSAGFSEVGPAAATSADNWRDLLDDLACLDTAGQVRSDGDDDLHFTIVG